MENWEHEPKMIQANVCIYIYVYTEMICIYIYTYIHVFMYPGSSYPLQEVGSTNSTIAGASVLISFQRFILELGENAI